jgi:hypothetical protein
MLSLYFEGKRDPDDWGSIFSPKRWYHTTELLVLLTQGHLRVMGHLDDVTCRNCRQEEESPHHILRTWPVMAG